jgi:putative ABC transport system permease protein
MSALRQSVVVSLLSLAEVPQRRWSSLVIVVGMACVVGVLLSMLSVTSGLLRAHFAASDPRRVIVVSQQASNENQGGLSREAVATIASAPGIRRGADGKVLASAEVVSQLPPAEGFAEGSLNVRGIGPVGLAIRPELRIVAGRMFGRGHHELIVGQAAHRMFHVKIGDVMILPDGDWRIVGIFSAGGGFLESELMADAGTLQTSARRTDFGSVLLQLDTPAELVKLRQWLQANPTLSVDAYPQPDYYLRKVSGVTGFFTAVALTVTTLLAIGALFGSVNIMYGAVSARVREIATLRAMGYESVPIAVSVVLEAIFLSLFGAAIGAGAAWLISNGKLNTAGSPVFENYVSPRLLAIGFGCAVVLALLGSLFPAIRAGRLSVADALRAR